MKGAQKNRKHTPNEIFSITVRAIEKIIYIGKKRKNSKTKIGHQHNKIPHLIIEWVDKEQKGGRKCKEILFCEKFYEKKDECCGNEKIYNIEQVKRPRGGRDMPGKKKGKRLHRPIMNAGAGTAVRQARLPRTTRKYFVQILP